MLKPNNPVFNDTLFSEGMKSNKKKAMIVGTYHLMLGPAAKEMISGLSDRMVQFVTEAPTEVRFELKLGHPGVDVNLTDAYLHAVVREAVDSSDGLDTDTTALLKQLQVIMGTIQEVTYKAAELVGASAMGVQMAQNAMYTPAIINDILNAINHQDFSDIDSKLQEFKKLENVLATATKLSDAEFNATLIPKELLDKYNSCMEEVTKKLIQRDRRWKFPTSDRVLICVGYEHTKFVTDVYRKKGYNILK